MHCTNVFFVTDSHTRLLFFFNDTATTEIYTLSLHDALPICIDAFGLFTGQVGYAWNNVLGYVKGGAAVTDNRYDGLATLTGTVTDRARDTRWGATVGAGIEYGFAPNWSAALEYDHLFMGTHNYAMTSVFPVAGFNTRNVDVKQDADLVTVRVN